MIVFLLHIFSLFHYNSGYAFVMTLWRFHLYDLADKDAEISELEAEIAAAKTKRIYDLATKDAEISELEAEIAASKTKHTWNIIVGFHFKIDAAIDFTFFSYFFAL